ncbi:MAG: hypothetical protein GX161_15460 [Firmicutes bacterium]|nr:hypothetical protein [Bacillota bacterium]
MRKVILVFLIMFLGLAPAYADTYVALVESQSWSLFNTIFAPMQDHIVVVPTEGRYMPQKMFLMITGEQSLDFVFDSVTRLRDYARNGLLRNLGSYDTLRHSLKGHREQLLIVDGIIVGFVHLGSPSLTTRVSARGIAVGRDSGVTGDTVTEFARLLLAARSSVPANPNLEARRAVNNLMDYLFLHADYQTAYLYLHPSRVKEGGPLGQSVDDLAHWVQQGFYHRFDVQHVATTEVYKKETWLNPYDGVEYQDVFEVRVRLRYRSGQQTLPYEFSVHVQKVDGEWLVFASRFGFE